jgi:hypothetical protein
MPIDVVLLLHTYSHINKLPRDLPLLKIVGKTGLLFSFHFDWCYLSVSLIVKVA